MNLRRTTAATVAALAIAAPAVALASSGHPASDTGGRQMAYELKDVYVSSYNLTARPPANGIIAVLIGL